ncbi:MAG: hypothetical protein AAGA29_05005 [Planctomycetota bacterium]
MDSGILVALIGAFTAITVAIVSGLVGMYLGRKRTFDDLDVAMDAAIELLRENLKSKADSPRAFAVVTKLRTHHSLNNIVAALYLLRERGIIRWEDANILKPNHRIELAIR